jgi:hypothetical protein
MIQRFGAFLAILIVLVGCRPGKKSLILRDPVCEAPCWHGIHPGISSMSDVLTQLAGMPEVKKIATGNSQTPGELDRVSWNFNPGVIECGGYVFLTNRLVSVIEVDTCGALTLSEIVVKFGNPNEVSAVASQREIRWLNISLLYPQSGLAVVAVEEGPWPLDRPGRIAQEQQVEHVFYFNPELYDVLLRSDSFLRVGACENEILSSLQPWRGFGDITFVDLSQSGIYCP